MTKAHNKMTKIKMNWKHKNDIQNKWKKHIQIKIKCKHKKHLNSNARKLLTTNK